jgi:hypothetical protein
MSKMKGQTFRYRLWNETKTFWYRSRLGLIDNRSYRSGTESALLDQIEMIFFGDTNSVTNYKTFWFHSERLWNVCGTFVSLLFDMIFFILATMAPLRMRREEQGQLTSGKYIY